MKIVKSNNFQVAPKLPLPPQSIGYFTRFEIFSHVGGSRGSHINLNSEIVSLKWVNPKYKTDCFIWTERELNWCHFAFKHSAQLSVEGISYVILLDRLYKDTRVVHRVTTSE